MMGGMPKNFQHLKATTKPAGLARVKASLVRILPCPRVSSSRLLLPFPTCIYLSTHSVISCDP